MSASSNHFQQLLELGAKHMRLLAYMVAVGIFTAGIYAGIYHPKMTALIPLVLVLSTAQSWLHRRLHNVVPAQATAITLLLDGLITGFGIAAVHYALVPMLVFIAMLNATVLGFWQSIFVGIYRLLLCTWLTVRWLCIWLRAWAYKNKFPPRLI
jgi:adenylate cyclase